MEGTKKKKKREREREQASLMLRNGQMHVVTHSSAAEAGNIHYPGTM
jgi:hypothetical protein